MQNFTQHTSSHLRGHLSRLIRWQDHPWYKCWLLRVAPLEYLQNPRRLSLPKHPNASKEKVWLNTEKAYRSKHRTSGGMTGCVCVCVRPMLAWFLQHYIAGRKHHVATLWGRYPKLPTTKNSREQTELKLIKLGSILAVRHVNKYGMGPEYGMNPGWFLKIHGGQQIG